MKKQTKKTKIRVRVMAFMLALVMAVMAVPEKAGASETITFTITKGYELPVKVMPRSVGIGGQMVFTPSKKDYLNRDYHIMPGCLCGTDSDKGYKEMNKIGKKEWENPKNDEYCVVWPVKKDYKGGIPKRVKYLAELSGRKCWSYPNCMGNGSKNELELYAPDELEKKVIEILKKRGFIYRPERLKKSYEMGDITKEEYEEYLNVKGNGGWTEISYPANLKSNDRPIVGSLWLPDKNRHSVDAYAKDLADAIEKHYLGSHKTLEKYKEYKRELYGEDEEWEGQYAPTFDLNYCGVWSEVNGTGRQMEGGKWVTKYTSICIRYVWKIY